MDQFSENISKYFLLDISPDMHQTALVDLQGLGLGN